MTDSPPTEVDPIFVKGQRRAPGGVYPPVSSGGSGLGPVQDELDPNGPPIDEPHPCDDPDNAREWNADAAAAEAFRRIRKYIADQMDSTHHLANREYGAMICERPNGTFFIGPIEHGPPIFDEIGVQPDGSNRPYVDIKIDSCGLGAIPIAMIHTHPSTGPSSGVPSSSDATWIAALNARRNDEYGRIYVVAIDGGKHRIEIYDKTNISAALTGEVGPEVNQNGVPCLAAGVIT
ncbi:hypothetical protein [Brevundimonas sp. 357]|uniref:hypothetical protein n=1 Tax=Brevundimonas sp. 357 TaxID=2555782 RepID=UPI000F79C9DF|nr:hypothetical protein [Brevundimonas sp. 357]